MNLRRLSSVILAVVLSSVNAAEPRFFDSDGVQLRYFESGSGETVVLLHGFSGSSEGLYINSGTFDALVGAGYRVVALDQRGHGGSDKLYGGADDYGMQMVEDVRRLLDHHGVARVHLVGYSMGGKVANMFREQYPDRLHTVTLGGYGWPWATPEVTPEEADARLRNMGILSGNDLSALRNVYAGMSQLTAAESGLRANIVPALAIIGDKDRAVPAKDRGRLVETMRNLEFVVIPGTHAGPDGAPYKPVFADRLIDFLDRN